MLATEAVLLSSVDPAMEILPAKAQRGLLLEPTAALETKLAGKTVLLSRMDPALESLPAKMYRGVPLEPTAVLGMILVTFFSRLKLGIIVVKNQVPARV